MRAIILVLLLGVAWGVPMPYFTHDEPGVEPSDTIIIMSEVGYSEKCITQALLSLYDQYAKECYADSMQVHCDNADDPTTLVYRTWTEWQHRQPTFTGFMEWLRGRK